MQYDTVYLGTTFSDSIHVQKHKNSLVIDVQPRYGTTTENFNTRYIRDLKVIKNIYEPPLKECSLGLITEKTEFAKITKLNIFFDEFTILPTKKHEIVDCKFMTFKDKRIYARKIKKSKSQILISKDEFSKNCYEILQRFTKNNSKTSLENSRTAILKYYFPNYGLTHVSELISMTNAFKGIGYLISENINIFEDHLITEYGIINFNRLIKKESVPQFNCKLIYKSDFLLKKSFFLNNSTKVIGLNPKFEHVGKKGALFMCWSKDIVDITFLTWLNISDWDYEVEFISLVDDDFLFQ